MVEHQARGQVDAAAIHEGAATIKSVGFDLLPFDI